MFAFVLALACDCDGIFRMVKWSDGSESLVLGNKVVDIRKKDMTQEHQCLFNFGQADTGMDAVETFDSRMILQL